MITETEQDRQDPFDTPEYAAFVESLVTECKCWPPECRPCESLLCGGGCERIGHRKSDMDDVECDGFDDEDDQ